ncbi:hypothetical protein FGG08_004776 [Glutinoglossum americanum]|uniref:Uncharacterized protein n=1 Tax=Glutinoglossum americanum TaxID=1670608 RepID=A0A9P8I1M6_9PEZI|nr:hypothetical protein FGG08_004776 [Glutinoglossum americanum]
MGTPITLTAFIAALPPLPLSTLRLKAHELQSNIAHLTSSNVQLEPYADAGDEVCREAIVENRDVIGRMEERLGAVRAEVERRGCRWEEEWGVVDGVSGEAGVEGDAGETTEVNGRAIEGEGETNENSGVVDGSETQQQQQQQQQERRGLSDSELSLALRQRLSEEGIDL